MQDPLTWCKHAYPDANIVEFSLAYVVHTNDVNCERFPMYVRQENPYLSAKSLRPWRTRLAAGSHVQIRLENNSYLPVQGNRLL